MPYLGLELYVLEERRRLAAERKNLPAQYHAEWLAERTPAGPPPHRAVLHSAGEMLIAIGERLRAWSVTRVAE